MDHSNSISPGSGMQPRDAQHPPPLHSTECTHTHGGRGGASSIEWERKTLGAVMDSAQNGSRSAILFGGPLLLLLDLTTTQLSSGNPSPGNGNLSLTNQQ